MGSATRSMRLTSMILRNWGDRSIRGWVFRNMLHGHSCLRRLFNSIQITQNFKKRWHAAQASPYPNSLISNQWGNHWTSLRRPLKSGISAAAPSAVCMIETTKTGVLSGFTSNSEISTECWNSVGMSMLSCRHWAQWDGSVSWAGRYSESGDLTS